MTVGVDVDPPASVSDKKQKACNRHQLSVREKYAERLEALGCICRALLAMGKESCCSPAKQSASINRKAGKSLVAKGSGQQKSSDTCCTTARARPDTSCLKRKSRQDPACSSASERETQSGCAEICCGASAVSGCSKLTQRSYATFSKPVHRNHDPETDSLEARRKLRKPGDQRQGREPSFHDLRPAAAPLEISEHVVVSISGMTCTGCETKLIRTLSTLAGVSNVKTSLLLSRAEFDIQHDLISADEVLKHLEKRTEFQCAVVNTSGLATLDVFYSGEAPPLLDQTWPDGVVDISALGKTFQVSYDPLVVGARDLVEKHWSGLVTLGPLCHDPGLAAGGRHTRNLAYMTLLSACLTIPVLVLAWAPLPENKVAYSSVSLALASIIQIVIVGPFYPKALKALIFSRVIEMDLLIVLSTSAAYIFSLVSYAHLMANKPLSIDQFFEASTLLVTLIMVGRYVAALARQKAVESISIRSLQAERALLMSSPGSPQTREIDVRLLQHGDTFKVLPDCKVPTDGTVLSGSSEVDESMLTGESRPVEKATGSPVTAGTINGSGALVVRLNRLPGENTIDTIAAMVDQAKLSKPKLQALADKVASYFVPVVVGLTLVTFVIWVAVGILTQNKTGSEAVVQAITYAITVLIVSCPCAIGLAVPMVIVIASGIAAERGVIFKSADAIEISYKASHVVFDKTGTLTQGILVVTEEKFVSASESASALLGLTEHSKHPISLAVSKHLRDRGVAAMAIPQAKSLTGKGLEAEHDGKILQAGNARWLGLSDHAAVRATLDQGQTAFCFVANKQLISVFSLEDAIRPGAKQVIECLKRDNVQVHVLSGDDEEPVQRIAAELGIEVQNTQSRRSPLDKQTYIKSLQEVGPSGKQPVVVFCGDGTNDAVALAQATVGIHMNEGNEVAQSAADVVLMRPDLTGVLTALKLSKVSTRRIYFNFAWCVVYNTFAVLLAAGAFVHGRLPPQFAGLGELVSVLPVIGAAVLLRWAKL